LIDLAHVVAVSEQAAAFVQPQFAHLRFKTSLQTARTDDEQPHIGVPRQQKFHGLHKHVEPFLRFQTADGAQRNVALPQTKRLADLSSHFVVTAEFAWIDPVKHDVDAIGLVTPADQFITDWTRYSDHQWKPAGDHPLGGIIEVSLARAMARPAVKGSHRDHAFQSRQTHGEVAGLVILCVHDGHA